MGIRRDVEHGSSLTCARWAACLLLWTGCDTSGSEVAGELTFYPNERLSLRTTLVYDPYTDAMNSGADDVNTVLQPM